MNLVTTQHSSNKFGSAFAAPRFSDLFYYFSYFGYFAGWRQGGFLNPVQSYAIVSATRLQICSMRFAISPKITNFVVD